MSPALLAVALDLPLELVDELVDRRLVVGGSLSGAQNRSLRPDRRLRYVVGRDRRIPLDGELELHPRGVRQLALELAELLLRVLPDRVRDLDVLALHLESHQDLP